MGLLDLMKSSESHAPKARKNPEKDPNKLYRMDMSKKSSDSGENHYPGNQGTVKFIPIAGIDGETVKYVYGVNQYLYSTPPNDDGNSYNVNVYYADPNDYQMNLSDDDRAKILKVRSLIEHFEANINGFPDAQTDKNYALIFGYILELQNVDGDLVCGKGQDGKIERRVALMYFPSKNFAKAMTQCCKDMCSMGEELANEMYIDLFSRNTDRTTYLQCTFEKGDGFGYDCTVTAKPIDRFSMSMLTPEELKEGKVTIPQECIDNCTSLSAIFFSGNRDGLEQFNALPEGDEEHPRIFIPDDFDSEYTDGVIAQIEKIINDAEAEKNKSEELPPVPSRGKSKNSKGKSDLDE